MADTTSPRFIVEQHIGDTCRVVDTQCLPGAGVFGPSPTVTVTISREAANQFAAEFNAGRFHGFKVADERNGYLR